MPLHSPRPPCRILGRIDTAGIVVAALALLAPSLGPIAIAAPSDCPPSNHPCDVPGEPGCSDVACCKAVCDFDPFCCFTNWDQQCIAAAALLCSPPDPCASADHGCFTPGGPGCTEIKCCQLVCAVDPFCCEASWDQNCVKQAGVGCECPVCTTYPWAIAEGESCFLPINFGCDLPPGQVTPLYTTLECGTARCGRLWAEGGAIDTDWYLVSAVDSDGDGLAELCFTFDAGTPTRFELFDGPCGSLFSLLDFTVTCQLGIRPCICVPAPATYRLKVSPLTSGLICGTVSEAEYVVEAYCSEPCSLLQGPCCYQLPGDPPGATQCAYTTATECKEAYNGTWLGTGATCATAACQSFAPCCEDPVCTILLRSGQHEGVPGLPGQVDSVVHCSFADSSECINDSIADENGMLPGCNYAPYVVTPYPGWKSTLDCDPAARWINTTIDQDLRGRPAQTAVYCHPFIACEEPFNTACITFCWMADDRLGDPPGDPAPVGLYLDNGPGTAITPIPAIFGGHYAFEQTVTAAIPPGAIKPGLNRLIVYKRDTACVASGVIYSARIDLCRSCIDPPWGMTGWWPLDEAVGVVSHDLTSNAIHGQWQGGPTPVAGVVDGALSFDGLDDVVVAPPSSALDVRCTAFTVDAWVNWTPGPAGSPDSVIAAHVNGSGWALQVSNGQPGSGPAGSLVLYLGTDCFRACTSSSGAILPSTWTHVAVSVAGCQCPQFGCGVPCCDDFLTYTRPFTFYINGQPAGTGSVYGCDLFLLPANLTIGGGNVPCNGTYFKGAIDEVEVFCRALSQAEIESIWRAGVHGKCKVQCWASSNRQTCGFGVASDVEATIVNKSSVSRTYSYSIAERPGCAVSGMTYVPATGAVTVGPYGGKASVTFGAQGGSASGYGKACFEVTFTNQATGEACSAFGSVIHKDCTIGPPPCCDPTGTIELPMGEAAFGSFQFAAGREGAALDYQVIAVPLDASMYDAPLSLGDLPPGEPIVGSFTAGPFEIIDFDFPILWNWCGWFAIGFELQFLVAPAGSGGPFQVISSSVVTMAAGSNCPADLDGDGAVGGADIGLLLGSWGGPGAADLDGSGVVDGADIGLLLGAWGPCL